jgi:hypothetical protein
VPPRRQRPLPQLDISLEALPPPESKRTSRLALAFTESEYDRIDKEARKRDEQPAVFCRTIVLTGFQNSALRVLADEPDLLRMSPTEQQRALLEAFSETPSPRRPSEPQLTPEILSPAESKRTRRLALYFTDNELAMIEKTARHRGEQPAVLCRTIVLTALHNSAVRAQEPDFRTMSPAEQQRALLEAFTFGD